MVFLCKVCDREILEYESEYKNYMATSRKKIDQTLYTKYTNNNINLDEIDQILDKHTTSCNKKFYFFLISCEFLIEIDNDFAANLETNYHYNKEIFNIKKYLIFDSYYFTSRG